METANHSVARTMEPMIAALLNGAPSPIRIEFWDGSTMGPEESPGLMRINSADALKRLIWSPGELGFGRAFVVGDVDLVGSVADILRTFQTVVTGRVGVSPSALPKVVDAARKLGVLGAPLPPPEEEMAPRGRRHSIRRDKQVISHHYDVGNDFYALVLGPSMTYSCARFVTPTMSLADAQAAKHELICRKVGLAEPAFVDACTGARPRLLDVGCGWGSMAMHAAMHHDTDVVAVTISESQAALARKRVAEAGLTDRVEIRIQDYRDVSDGPYDAISSIGMAEHVGKKEMTNYFTGLHAQLRPGGRMLNHAISSIGGSKLSRTSFVGRYVFPDGELLDLADTILSMQAAGFEVRDVENLREHYAETLGNWVANLEAHWDEAVALAGERRARVWQLYMSGSRNGFFDGGLQLHQTLGVKPINGRSAMPPTRSHWG